ncbi:MAG: nucleotidyltransferase domain-containing protein [Euryarchaeota archaeon]|nr:nucleotidyltransferase domain-containing protein [Euryarchaeota archaeon]
MPKIDRRKEALEEFVKRAKDEHGPKIEKIILFGSYARGDYSEESDVDILVVWTGEEEEGWREMTRIAFNVLLDTEEYISVKVLSPDDMKTDNVFVKSVLKDGIAYA